jgi:hypothetical protein
VVCEARRSGREDFAAVDRGPSQRRKTLRAALVGWTGGADTAAAVLYAAGVPAGARGESFTMEQSAPTIGSTCDRHWRMNECDRSRPAASGSVLVRVPAKINLRPGLARCGRAAATS